MQIPYIINHNPPLIPCETYREHVLRDPSVVLNGDWPIDHYDSLIRHQHTCLACVEWQFIELNRNDLPRSILDIRETLQQRLLVIRQHLSQAPSDNTGRI